MKIISFDLKFKSDICYVDFNNTYQLSYYPYGGNIDYCSKFNKYLTQWISPAIFTNSVSAWI